MSFKGGRMSEVSIYFSAMAGMGCALAIIQQIFDKSFQRKMSTPLAFSFSIMFVTLFQILPVLYFRSMMTKAGNADAALGALIAITGFILFWLLLEKLMPSMTDEQPIPGQAARAYAKVVRDRDY